MQDTVVFKKNMEYMKSRYPGFEENWNRYQNHQEGIIVEYETYDRQFGLYVKRDNDITQLNSQFEADNYAREWADYIVKKEKIQKGSVIWVFGMGNISYIRALMETCPDNCRMIIYEPCQEILFKVMYRCDLPELLTGKAELLVNHLNDQWMEKCWNAYMDVGNSSLRHLIALPNYPNIFSKELNDFSKMLDEFLDWEGISWNTLTFFGKKAAENHLRIMPQLIRSYDLLKLIQQLPKDYPAIVVAAGPSLRKNIKELRNAKNKAFIIAVDTAMRVLIEEDIIPDIYVTIDSKKDAELFEYAQIHDVPVCIEQWSVPEAVERQTNKIFVSFARCFLLEYCAEFMEDWIQLASGGTVAQIAFSLVIAAKMSPVILVGQDLAFTDEQTHATGAFKKERQVSDIDDDKIRWVEDVHGNMIKTMDNLVVYKEWYEKEIQNLKGSIRVIDATEGGARIIGTEIMTLKDAIEKECQREFDYGAVIQSIPMWLPKESQEGIIHKFSYLPMRLKHLEKKACEAIGLYERMEVLAQREGMLDGKEIKQNMKKLDILTGDIEKSPEYALILPYISTALKENLYDIDAETDDIRSDLKNISGRGLNLMQAIREALQELLPQVEEMIQKL